MRTNWSSPLQGEIEGVGNFKTTTGGNTQSSTLWNPSPVSPKEGEAVCLLAEKAY